MVSHFNWSFGYCGPRSYRCSYMVSENILSTTPHILSHILSKYWYVSLSFLHLFYHYSALKGLFGILQSYGSLFNTGVWQLIFRGVLLPIFDNVRYASSTDLLQEVIYFDPFYLSVYPVSSSSSLLQIVLIVIHSFRIFSILFSSYK